METKLSNKTVFITGASKGIGRAIKDSFLAENARVIVPTRDQLDLSCARAIDSYLKENTDLSPDVFIHCAGINELAGIEEISRELLDRVFQVNFFSAVQLLNRFVTTMKGKKWGRIILISSLYAIVTRERRIAYSASKNALTGLCKTLALELAGTNIMVNCIAPGYVMTEMTKKNLTKEEIQCIEKNIPTGRFQTEQEIADICVFLSSNLNQSITGQLIPVDGGFTCK